MNETFAPNKALFDQIADIIEMHPERYDQGDWTSDTEFGEAVGDPMKRECNTAFCIAGWALAITDPAKAKRFSEYKPLPGENVDWEGAGAKALGLDSCSAYILFDGSWSPHRDIEYGDTDKEKVAKEVAKALRAIGNGDPVEDHTHEDD